MMTMISRDMEPMIGDFWRPLRQLEDVIDQLTSATRMPLDARRSEYIPSFELDETEDHYVMSFDIPGVRRDDLSIEVTGNQLIVSGERKTESQNSTRQYGRFRQQFTLPDGVVADAIVAEHKDGVLRLAIEKPVSAKVTKIKITDGKSQPREGGFFKNLVASKKVRDSIDVKDVPLNSESVAMAN